MGGTVVGAKLGDPMGGCWGCASAGARSPLGGRGTRWRNPPHTAAAPMLKVGARAMAMARASPRRGGGGAEEGGVQGEQQPVQGETWSRKLAAGAVASAAALAVLASPQAGLAGLVSSNPIKDGRVLLRNALPLDAKNPIRAVQRQLESPISEALRVPGVKFSAVGSAVDRSLAIVTSSQKRDAILAAVPAGPKRDAASDKLDAVVTDLRAFQSVVERKDKQEVPVVQQKVLTKVGEIEESMVDKFPYEVPREYASLPQLKGRATLEMKVKLKDAAARSLDYDRFDLQIVVDGYSAPVSAGNFVDLVQRKFYNGMEIQRSDGFVVQTGDPDGPPEGFIDPSTGEIRRIPFEVMVEGGKAPLYEETLEDLGRFNEQPVLPFNAYGTLAWARSEFEPNSASSQFFFLLRDAELTPTGSNLLDGRYAVFGYVTSGKDFLESLKAGDTIESVRVVSGAENLVSPS